MLVLMTGLPGTGKSTIAATVAGAIGGCAVSADPIDAALARAGVTNEQGKVGYEVMKALAAGELAYGRSVVIDAVNPFRFVRQAYFDLAASHDTPVAVLVTTCSDTALHQHRIAARLARGEKDIEWRGVQDQMAYYEPYEGECLVLDSVRAIATNSATATDYVLARLA